MLDVSRREMVPINSYFNPTRTARETENHKGKCFRCAATARNVSKVGRMRDIPELRADLLCIHWKVVLIGPERDDFEVVQHDPSVSNFAGWNIAANCDFGKCGRNAERRETCE
jgi:hypothetical protein